MRIFSRAHRRVGEVNRGQKLDRLAFCGSPGCLPVNVERLANLNINAQHGVKRTQRILWDESNTGAADLASARFRQIYQRYA